VNWVFENLGIFENNSGAHLQKKKEGRKWLGGVTTKKQTRDGGKPRRKEIAKQHITSGTINSSKEKARESECPTTGVKGTTDVPLEKGKKRYSCGV